MSGKQDPVISLFAAASVGAFLLTSWLAHDYANIIIPFLFLSMICANGFGSVSYTHLTLPTRAHVVLGGGGGGG